MWKLTALALAALHLQVCVGQLKVPKEPNVLTPPYFNIATGKRIQSTATCGEEKPQVFCKLTGGPNEYDFNENLYQGQFCDVCDSNDQAKSHPIKYAIDGTEKWWQSPPLSEGQQYNEINITIHLGQVFHVAYVIIKFANSPRAGTWVLERSSDHGNSFQPWQYFANSDSDCHNQFGIDAFEEITSDNSVICTAEYSDVVPLERGEVIVSMINHRPGAKNFSHSPILQEWSKATDIRLRLLRTKTLLGHLMAVQRQDPTVTRRYFYSIKDVSVGGRCVCNGHAETCLPDPLDKYKLKCECKHNTCGDSCEYCCPGFVQKAWRAAIPESSNECEACNCYGHSTECIYDEQVAIRRQSLDLSGEYEGGGVCQNCAHNTAGINCEKCVDGYYRPANVDPRDPNGCRPCDCNSTFTVGTCEPVTGRCYCKPKYAGDRCDRCAPGYHQFPECEPCPCYYNGTRDGVCLPQDDVCPCKYNYAGRFCSQCASGFYNFPECTPCTCTGLGAVNAICDVHDGQCVCEDGFGGQSCDQCSPGYYNYPVCQACSCFATFTTAEVCDPVNGQCYCADPVTGPSCNQCKPGYYGFPQCKECECDSAGSANALCDSVSGKCVCKTGFSGSGCDECAPEYYNYPNCVECNCHGQGSQRTTCDAVTGDCTCFENISGRRCDQCSPEYFNFPTCEDCKCNQLGITSFVPGVCLAFSTGQCECKENVVGVYCDSCKPLYYNLTLGCVDCNCFHQGTLDGVAACDTENGDCWCKPYTCTRTCSQCDDGFYSLEERNYFGCTGCQCNAGGSMSQECAKVDGQCPCKTGVTGRKCDIVKEGYYYPTLLQPKYEVEDGRTVDDDILRFGFDEEKFPRYSLKGYGEFSVVQRAVIVHVVVDSHGLYKIQFSYVNPGRTSVANVTLTPVLATGAEQHFQIEFEESATPALLTGPVVVLNFGQWDVKIEGDPGLLVDYIALLPSSYYTPSVFQAKITEPCVPTTSATGKECLMYEHPSLGEFPQTPMVDVTDRDQHDSPTTAHPPMVFLDGNSIEDSKKSVAVQLNGIDSAGKYVLVLVYASPENRMQTLKATVRDGAGQEYSDVNFNIYSCLYSFLCRQVALTNMRDVYVFDVSIPSIHVELMADAGESVYVKDIYAIPYDKWTMEYVEPKRKCITKEGPEFEECITGAYPIPPQATKIEPEIASTSVGDPDSDSDSDDATPPTDPDASAVLGVGGKNNPIVINMNLKPGRYVFVLHYLNPDHTSFTPDVVISDGIVHNGGANITYCPDEDGCRAVVVTDDGAFVLDINSPTQTMTITVPDGKNFLLDYILAIPEESYDASVLDVLPLDLSRKYFDECYHIGTKGVVESTEELPEFCKDAIFTLTTDFNDGALRCDCSGEGTVGGGDADCEDYGGQCPCKPGVIGRNCDRCKTGYFGFPDCQPCNCNGSLCDEINGNCICPPNTVQPGCDSCLPFTHSFHALAGCKACDCHPDGVENAQDLGCSQDNGQCRCKENVEGINCDKCASGFYGFPNCRSCVCNSGGITQDGCDAENGQCTCKENVEGQQCDRCKAGTFHLDSNNPLGCTSCFCFGVATECAATQFPLKEIVDMDGWRLLNMKTDAPEVTRIGDTVSVDVFENGGAKEQTVLYWAAPKAYLERKIGSYGGKLRFVTDTQLQYEEGGRGDSSSGTGGTPSRLTSPGPTVILEEGQGLVIEWTNRDRPSGAGEQSVQLIESNFVHKESGEPVKRSEMMLVLERLESLRIRATDYSDPLIVSLSGVSMTTTDYDADRGSGEVIPTVEMCTCPPEYVGNSCEMCARGHYRAREQGPYLGYCLQCDCFGHCDSCDANGLVDGKGCKHNTVGDRCQSCEDGYIGNATSGDPEACQPCPCPFPNVEGNFASKCEYDAENNVICTCQPGYAGEKCDQCAQGYFGNPSVIGGECIECNCHGNLDPNLIMEVCDPITGQCKECVGNTGGKYCERCADGYYGDALTAKNCTKCECDECGTLQCDDRTGDCACKANVIGFTCNSCESEFWNLGTCSGCLNCNCDIGAIDNVCDMESGICRCAPNVIGQRCDKCAPGHWDYSSLGCKPCNCRNNGDCNPVNGECTCPPGITGQQCDECKLERHVLSPSGLQCESCDSCTISLLNDIEPLTDDAKHSTMKLSNVSAGVAAAKRLEVLQEEADDVSDKVKEASDQLEETEKEADMLLESATQPVIAPMLGSGEDGYEMSGELPSTILGENDEVDSYIALREAVTETEEAVSAVCNKSQDVLEAVTSTNSRAADLDSNTTIIAGNIEQFSEDSQDLLDKLVEESTGDSEEYLRSLLSAQMMITKMKESNFTPMQDLADEEVKQAEILFQEVNINFTVPADDLESRWNATSNALTEKSNKMKEMRKRLNNASMLVTETNTLNAANLKALGIAKDAIADINTQWKDINDTVKNTMGEALTSEILDTEELNILTDSLQKREDSYNATLEGMDDLVKEAILHTAMLEMEADELQRLVNETENDPPVEAVNRYGTILNTINEAEKIANATDLDATEVANEVAEQDLEQNAQKADVASDQLLDYVAGRQERANGLSDDFQAAENSTGIVNQQLALGTDSLDAIKKRISDIDEDEVNEKVSEAKLIAAESNNISDSIMKEAKLLEKKIESAPDPNIDMGAEVADTNGEIQEIQDKLDEAKAKLAEVTKTGQRVAQMPGELKLNSKIAAIKKNIEMSRNRAGMVSVAMGFKKKTLEDGVYPEYAQVNIPQHAFELTDQTDIEINVNISKSPDNSLLYLGSEDSGDYVALETIDGLVHYYYKAGDGLGELVSEVAINDERWHKILIERNKAVARLTVYYQDASRCRGDSCDSNALLTDEQEATITGSDIAADLAMESTPLVIGGMPIDPQPGNLQNNQMAGCVKDVKVNNEGVGIWNFVYYNGPLPGKSCSDTEGRTSSSESWRFRGIDSYIMISEQQIKSLRYDDPGSLLKFIGFKFSTKQKNQLFFLVGASIDQFFALELKDGGTFVLTYNFGFDEPRTKTAKRVQDYSIVDQPLSLKFGFIPKKGDRAALFILLVNNELIMRLDYQDDWNMQIEGAFWLGGVHQSNQFEGLSDSVSNINNNFRGCIKDLKITVNQAYQIYKADERVGVTFGCQNKDVPAIGHKDKVSISIATHYPRVEFIDSLTEETTSAPVATTTTEAFVVIPDDMIPTERTPPPLPTPADYDEPPPEEDDEEQLNAKSLNVTVPAEQRELETEKPTSGRNQSISGKSVDFDDGFLKAGASDSAEFAADSVTDIATKYPYETLGRDAGFDSNAAHPSLKSLDIGSRPIEAGNDLEQPMVAKNVSKVLGLPLQRDDGDFAAEPYKQSNLDVKDSDVGVDSVDANTEQEDGPSGSVLPALLVIIGVIVCAVVVGATISAILQGGLFGGAGVQPPPIPPASPDRAPLNDVQAQRIAHMDW